MRWPARQWGRTEQKREEATALYRLCACAGEMNETGSQSYFNASRHLRQTQLALAMLERRFDRLGKRSSQPACTLFCALKLLDRVPEALVVLERVRRCVRTTEICCFMPPALMGDAEIYPRPTHFSTPPPARRITTPGFAAPLKSLHMKVICPRRWSFGERC